jgi:hypothetical protein
VLTVNLLQFYEFHIEGVEHPGSIEVGSLVK